MIRYIKYKTFSGKWYSGKLPSQVKEKNLMKEVWFKGERVGVPGSDYYKVFINYRNFMSVGSINQSQDSRLKIISGINGKEITQYYV